MHQGLKLGLMRIRDRLQVAVVAPLLMMVLVLALPACTGLFTSPTTLQTPSGPVTAVLGDGDEFPRFNMPDHGDALAASDVADDADLLILERDGRARALLVSEMSWHHVAQGTLGGHPIAAVY
jgi:hypothetical protein